MMHWMSMLMYRLAPDGVSVPETLAVWWLGAPVLAR